MIHNIPFATPDDMTKEEAMAKLQEVTDYVIEELRDRANNFGIEAADILSGEVGPDDYDDDIEHEMHEISKHLHFLCGTGLVKNDEHHSFTMLLYDDEGRDVHCVADVTGPADRDAFEADFIECEGETIEENPEDWNYTDIFTVMKERGWRITPVDAVKVYS